MVDTRRDRRQHPPATPPPAPGVPVLHLLPLLAGTVAVAAPSSATELSSRGAAAAHEAEAIAADIGPRPAGGAAEAGLKTRVTAALTDAGWPVQTVAGQLVACRGRGDRLFLAHLDSVPDSPGAVDNAAGVAALLSLAAHNAATDLCLAFPQAEEVGLVGSEALAAAWPDSGLSRQGLSQPGAPGDGLPALVVALDLVGQGELSVTGLGPRWGGAQLRWLVDHADLTSPYAYRVVSHALPGMERSDHRPFADRGALAMQLLGRGDGGVFARYHQPADTEVDPAAMGDLLATLERLATAPLPPTDPPDDAALALGQVLPAPLASLLIGLGLLSGLADLLLPCEGRPVFGALRGQLRMLPRALIGGAVAAALLWLSTTTGLWAPPTAEQTAAAVMGTPATGWWTGAAPGSLLGLVGFVAVRRRLGGRGSAPLAAALLTALALLVDPLLALPFAVAALAARLHPLLALGPALYLLWPDKLRELAFHGLLSPRYWGLLWILAWPAMGARGAPLLRRSRGTG